MGDTVFDKVTDLERGAMARLRRFCVEYFPYIMLAVNLAFEVLTRLFEIGFTVPFTPDFWASLFINTTSSTLSYACFVFYAERKKKEISEEYASNVKLWSSLSASVRLNSFDAFIAYCKQEYELEIEERRKAIIANNTHISISKWMELYRTKRNREINALVRSGELEKRDARYIKRANAPMVLKPIDALLILAGMKVGSLNDAGRQNTSTARSILTRPIPVVMMSICFTMFGGTFVGVADSSVLFDMLYTAGMIIGSSLIGYTKGVANFEHKHAEIKARIIFLERFEKSR
jgi:hypothetical protein